jgi:hypothetical protein
MTDIISVQSITNRIYLIRGLKVMIDRDLAELYGVETKQLKREVRRNIDRFPSDFMFELTIEEYNFLRCQIGTLKRGKHSKYVLMAFTEQGVAMLPTLHFSTLRSQHSVFFSSLLTSYFSLFTSQPSALSPHSFLLPFPALAILDYREAGQVKTCAAATGGFGTCIGELQAAANQIVRVVYDQAVQILAAFLIRDNPNISALQDDTLTFLHLPVNVGTIGQTGTTAFSNGNTQKLIRFQLVSQHLPGFFLNDNFHD